MEVVSIGLICLGGMIIFNNVSMTYNLLNPKPKIYKVQKYVKNIKLSVEEEFDSQYNQLYEQNNQYILVEEQEQNVVKQQANKAIKVSKEQIETISKKVSTFGKEKGKIKS